MATERDRFGEKLRDAEKAHEDVYFAKRDKELIEKLRRQKEQAFKDDLQAAASMVCPRCGQALEEQVEHGVRVDECPGCGGLWLDKGEFEVLAAHEESGWFGRLFRSRKPAKP
jgi:rubrerythrin